MKTPYFNQEQRTAIHLDTMLGAHLTLNLEVRKLLRAVYRENGWLSMKKAERVVIRIANMKLLGRDAPKKWWKLF